MIQSTSSLRSGRVACPRSSASRLEVSSQVHPGVKVADLFGVPVEEQRVAPAVLADAPLARLAPARVADVRVDVRVEAVLPRRVVVPRRLGLVAHEANLND